MLTLLAYARYARQPALGRYLLVFAALALGLMSKPMLVTLPLVLLLLDYWPLRRFGGPWGSGLFFGPQAALAGGLGGEDLGRQSPRGPSPRPGRKSRNRRAAAAAAAPESPARFPPLVPLLLEKLPLLALSVAVSIVTYRSQTHAMSLLGNEATLPARLSNALVGYASYLGMTFWPYPLAALYPFVKHPPWQAAAAAALLAAITAAVLWPLRRRPLPGRRLVLVSGNPGAGDRPGAGRHPIDRRPLHLYAPDWHLHHGGLGRRRLDGRMVRPRTATALDPRGRRRPGCGRGPNPPTTPLLVRQRAALHP